VCEGSPEGTSQSGEGAGGGVVLPPTRELIDFSAPKVFSYQEHNELSNERVQDTLETVYGAIARSLWKNRAPDELIARLAADIQERDWRYFNRSDFVETAYGPRTAHP